MSYTPGPWAVMTGGSTGVYVTAEATPIANVNIGNKHNARLIAAAPKLLAALKAAKKDFIYSNHSWDSEEQVDKAIARAEGRR